MARTFSVQAPVDTIINVFHVVILELQQLETNVWSVKLKLSNGDAYVERYATEAEARAARDAWRQRVEAAR